MPGDNARLVYSTDGGRVRDPAPTRARKPVSAGSARGPAVPDDGVVRIRRETQGRRGKVVTTITGLPGDDAALAALLTMLKQLCGAGGTRVGSVFEIQGDHRERVQAKLESLGHRVKLAGG